MNSLKYIYNKGNQHLNVFVPDFKYELLLILCHPNNQNK